MKRADNRFIISATVYWPARVFFSGLLAIFLSLSTGCLRQAEESPVQQLKQLGTFYGVQWPTNYANDQAGSLRYSARDFANNTVAVVCLQLDGASYQSWYSQVTNQMNVYEGLSAHVDPMIVKSFPWYNPQVYPASRVTRFVCETNSNKVLVAKLTVHAVNSNGVHLLFISSRISKK
jgi:hypothetical protein